MTDVDRQLHSYNVKKYNAHSFCNNIIIGKRKLVQSGYYYLLYPVHYVLMTTYRRPVRTRL